MRPRLEPRLQLARTADRAPNWIIRDGVRTIRTGAKEHEADKANEALVDYLVLSGRVAGFRADIAPRAKAAEPTTIYFITCGLPDFPIKIGIASNIQRRLSQLQNAIPFDAIILATTPGIFFHEKILHRQFGHLRIRGEWFRRDPSLMGAIEQIKDGNYEWPVPFGGDHE